MTTTIEQRHQLYHAAMEADECLSRALQARFGAQAGNRRYDARTYRQSPVLRELADQSAAAQDAYRRATQGAEYGDRRGVWVS